jgi:hypothetical protein
MAQPSKKQLPPQQRSSSSKQEELVPIQFTLDAELHAFLEHIAARSGKSVSEIACMYLEVAVDTDAKIDPSVDRALQQIVAEDIARRFGPLLHLMSPRKVTEKVIN